MTQAKVAPAGGGGSAGMRADPRTSSPESGPPPRVTLWADHSGNLHRIEYGCVDWYMYEIEASPTSGHDRYPSAAAGY